MIIKETIPPEGEPVSLEDFKIHARIDTSEEDGYILAILKASRQAIERRLDIAGPMRTVEVIADGFPRDSSRPVFLPISPLDSVVSVVYRDGEGDEWEWPIEAYRVERGEGGYILPIAGEPYPPAIGFGSVVVTAVFGSEETPEDLKHAIKILASTWYENRESIGTGSIPPIPHGFDFLLSGLRQRSF